VFADHLLHQHKAYIDVGAGEIQFTINGAQEKFNFKPKVEQCSMILATELATIISLTHTKKKAKSKPRSKAKQIWKRKMCLHPRRPLQHHREVLMKGLEATALPSR